MRLPQPLLNSQFFSLTSAKDLVAAMGSAVDAAELAEIERLVASGLAPVSSRAALASMLGINPGLIWSFENRTQRHYRTFFIKKGNGRRKIDAPKVGLKVIQKWMSVQLQRSFEPGDHVFGFVAGRSHVDAAGCHVDAKWLFSVDIKDYFQTTPIANVEAALELLGYGPEGAKLLAKLFCLNGFLAQGSPASPIVSNIVFSDVDRRLLEIATRYEVRLSRYADDIVFSGTGEMPEQLPAEVEQVILETPWRLSPSKTEMLSAPKRLKVHGLLVHGPTVRLTKGYRNRIRALKHLSILGRIGKATREKVKGHLLYAAFISARSEFRLDDPRPEDARID